MPMLNCAGWGRCSQPLGLNQASIQSRNGVLFLTVTAMVFTSASSIVLVFPLEKLQLIRDQSTGMYRTWTYSLAKFFSDLPISTALPFLFSLIFYWFVGLSNTASQFFLFFFINWLIVGVGNSIGMLLGSAFSDAEVAVSIMPMVIVPLMLFAGLFISTWPPIPHPQRERERMCVHEQHRLGWGSHTMPYLTTPLSMYDRFLTSLCISLWHRPGQYPGVGKLDPMDLYLQVGL